MLQEFISGDKSAGRTPLAGKYDQLWQLSMSDPHTGLANQLLVLDRLTQAIARMRRHGGEVVVCHVNLDNLGEINTDLGYTIGNTVLCEMADRLTSVLRTEDTVGRVGGNELVGGPPDTPAPEGARRAGRRRRARDPAARRSRRRSGRGRGVGGGRVGPRGSVHPRRQSLRTARVPGPENPCNPGTETDDGFGPKTAVERRPGPKLGL